MADETQIELGDEAANGFGEQPPAGRCETAYRDLFGRDFAAGPAAQQGRYAALGAASVAKQAQAMARFAIDGQRALLAADLLRANAGLPIAEWSDIAAKALAAAAIIYPDPKEAE